jgi:hypothetical protein
MKKLNLEELKQVLVRLDKKAEEFDQTLRNLRIEIHNILWDLIEAKEGKMAEKANIFRFIA